MEFPTQDTPFLVANVQFTEWITQAEFVEKDLETLERASVFPVRLKHWLAVLWIILS